MSQQFVLGGQTGGIYCIKADGDLLWYGDLTRNGTVGWHPRSGTRIGNGWTNLRFVFGGHDGILYAIRNTGELLWYRDLDRNGNRNWDANSGRQIGSGWQDFRLVFGGHNGVIYAIKNDGDLLWYRDLARNGQTNWDPRSGSKIGSGWQVCRMAFGGEEGKIYAVSTSGDLLWYHDVAGNGTVGWGANSGNRIGTGWNEMTYVLGANEGLIYAVDGAARLRWYRDANRNGVAGWAAGSGNQIGSGWLNVEWSPALAQLGHSSMTRDGKPALGPRRLLVVLAEYDNDRDNNFPTFQSVHPGDYYQKLAFGAPTPPFSTSNPQNPASLDGYLRENSGNRFWLERLGVVGPLRMGPLGTDPGPEIRSRRILERVASANPRLFLDSDTNGDGVVSSSEIIVLLVENIAGLLPANRHNHPFLVRWPSPAGPLGPGKSVNLSVAFAGPRTPFYQIAHEVSHCLGTIDLYNSGAGNQLLTLMSGYSLFSNDQGTVHLDGWHKFALGWCEPRRRRITRPGQEQVVEVSRSVPTGALILWHPDREAREFFLIERRRRDGINGAYDSAVAGNGALVWRVTPQAAIPVTHLSGPTLTIGGNQVWQPGTTTPALTWSDGGSTGVRLSFNAGSNPQGIGVSWS